MVAGDGGLDEKDFINDPNLPASTGGDITSGPIFKIVSMALFQKMLLTVFLDKVIGKLMLLNNL